MYALVLLFIFCALAYCSNEEILYIYDQNYIPQLHSNHFSPLQHLPIEYSNDEETSLSLRPNNACNEHPLRFSLFLNTTSTPFTLAHTCNVAIPSHNSTHITHPSHGSTFYPNITLITLPSTPQNDFQLVFNNFNDFIPQIQKGFTFKYIPTTHFQFYITHVNYINYKLLAIHSLLYSPNNHTIQMKNLPFELIHDQNDSNPDSLLSQIHFGLPPILIHPLSSSQYSSINTPHITIRKITSPIINTKKTNQQTLWIFVTFQHLISSLALTHATHLFLPIEFVIDNHFNSTREQTKTKALSTSLTSSISSTLTSSSISSTSPSLQTFSSSSIRALCPSDRISADCFRFSPRIESSAAQAYVPSLILTTPAQIVLRTSFIGLISSTPTQIKCSMGDYILFNQPITIQAIIPFSIPLSFTDNLWLYVPDLANGEVFVSPVICTFTPIGQDYAISSTVIPTVSIEKLCIKPCNPTSSYGCTFTPVLNSPLSSSVPPSMKNLSEIDPTLMTMERTCVCKEQYTSFIFDALCSFSHFSLKSVYNYSSVDIPYPVLSQSLSVLHIDEKSFLSPSNIDSTQFSFNSNYTTTNTNTTATTLTSTGSSSTLLPDNIYMYSGEIGQEIPFLFSTTQFSTLISRTMPFLSVLPLDDDFSDPLQSTQFIQSTEPPNPTDIEPAASDPTADRPLPTINVFFAPINSPHFPTPMITSETLSINISSTLLSVTTTNLNKDSIGDPSGTIFNPTPPRTPLESFIPTPTSLENFLIHYIFPANLTIPSQLSPRLYEIIISIPSSSTSSNIALPTPSRFFLQVFSQRLIPNLTFTPRNPTPLNHITLNWPIPQRSLESPTIYYRFGLFNDTTHQCNLNLRSTLFLPSQNDPNDFVKHTNLYLVPETAGEAQISLLELALVMKNGLNTICMEPVNLHRHYLSFVPPSDFISTLTTPLYSVNSGYYMAHISIDFNSSGGLALTKDWILCENNGTLAISSKTPPVASCICKDDFNGLRCQQKGLLNSISSVIFGPTGFVSSPISDTITPSVHIISKAFSGDCTLKCIGMMIPDSICSQCICTSPLCISRSRVIPLDLQLQPYLSLLLQQDPSAWKELPDLSWLKILRSTTLSNQLTRELTLMLQPNRLPPSSLYTQFRTSLYTFRDYLGYPVGPPSLFTPPLQPIGIEDIQIIFLSANSLALTPTSYISCVVYLTITPFDDAIRPTTVATRFYELQSQLNQFSQPLLHVGSIHPYQRKPLITPSIIGANSVFILPTLQQIFFYSLVLDQPLLTTVCNAPNRAQIQCAQIYDIPSSPYWTSCASVAFSYISPSCVLLTSQSAITPRNSACSPYWPYYPPSLSRSCDVPTEITFHFVNQFPPSLRILDSIQLQWLYHGLLPYNISICLLVNIPTTTSASPNTNTPTSPTHRLLLHIIQSAQTQLSLTIPSTIPFQLLATPYDMYDELSSSIVSIRAISAQIELKLESPTPLIITSPTFLILPSSECASLEKTCHATPNAFCNNLSPGCECNPGYILSSTKPHRFSFAYSQKPPLLQDPSNINSPRINVVEILSSSPMVNFYGMHCMTPCHGNGIYNYTTSSCTCNTGYRGIHCGTTLDKCNDLEWNTFLNTDVSPSCSKSGISSACASFHPRTLLPESTSSNLQHYQSHQYSQHNTYHSTHILEIKKTSFASLSNSKQNRFYLDQMSDSTHQITQTTPSTCLCYNLFNGDTCEKCQLQTMCSLNGTNWPKTMEKCFECVCQIGYSGSKCQIRGLYATLITHRLNIQGDDIDGIATLSALKVFELQTDLASAIGIDFNIVKLVQYGYQYSPKLKELHGKFIFFIDIPSPSSTQAYEFDASSNAQFDSMQSSPPPDLASTLYSKWSIFLASWNSSILTTSPVLKPFGALITPLDAYDPNCDILSSDCPLGINPFSFDILEPIQPADASTRSFKKVSSIVIIVPIVVGLVVLFLIIFGVFLTGLLVAYKTFFITLLRDGSILHEITPQSIEKQPTNFCFYFHRRSSDSFQTAPNSSKSNTNNDIELQILSSQQLSVRDNYNSNEFSPRSTQLTLAFPLDDPSISSTQTGSYRLSSRPQLIPSNYTHTQHIHHTQHTHSDRTSTQYNFPSTSHSDPHSPPKILTTITASPTSSIPPTISPFNSSIQLVLAQTNNPSQCIPSLNPNMDPNRRLSAIGSVGSGINLDQQLSSQLLYASEDQSHSSSLEFTQDDEEFNTSTISDQKIEPAVGVSVDIGVRGQQSPDYATHYDQATSTLLIPNSRNPLELLHYDVTNIDLISQRTDLALASQQFCPQPTQVQSISPTPQQLHFPILDEDSTKSSSDLSFSNGLENYSRDHVARNISKEPHFYPQIPKRPHLAQGTWALNTLNGSRPNFNLEGLDPIRSNLPNNIIHHEFYLQTPPIDSDSMSLDSADLRPSSINSDHSPPLSHHLTLHERRQFHNNNKLLKDNSTLCINAKHSLDRQSTPISQNYSPKSQ